MIVLNKYMRMKHVVSNSENLHIYSNVMAESFVFKSHCDGHCVLVQCIGMSEYTFEDGSVYQLQPGDGIYIPRGIYHAPRVFGPRVTFSYNTSIPVR